MVRLIIACLPAEDNVCGWGKAYADPLVASAGVACAFFLWGWSAGTRALQLKHRDALRKRSGCPAAHGGNEHPAV
jgi:hypothetical protein